MEGLVRRAHSGLALGGALNTRRVLVGRPAWLAEQGITVPEEVRSAVGQQEEAGATAVAVAWNGTAGGVIALRDPAKPTSARAVAELQELGLRPYLLTGDSEGAARIAAQAVGIPDADVIARVLPADKAAVVARLPGRGPHGGDGGRRRERRRRARHRRPRPRDGHGHRRGDRGERHHARPRRPAGRRERRTPVPEDLRIIKQNLFWAFAYNVAAIPLAAAGLLSPMIAGGAMAASSVLVVLNSLRLRRAV